MRPTHLSGPLTDRTLDVLDIAVAEAMLLQGLGPGTDAMRVEHRPDGTVRVHLTPLGRSVLTEMAATTQMVELEGWMELLAPGLVEDAVAVVGEDWRPEAELAVELLAAERADDMGALAAIAVRDDLVTDGDRSLGQILAEVVCDPQLALLM